MQKLTTDPENTILFCALYTVTCVFCQIFYSWGRAVLWVWQWEVSVCLWRWHNSWQVENDMPIQTCQVKRYRRHGDTGKKFKQGFTVVSVPVYYIVYRCTGVCVLSRFSHVQLFATLWTIAHQAPLHMGFSKQKYWSGLPYPPPGDLPNPGTEPSSPAAPACRQILYC